MYHLKYAIVTAAGLGSRLGHGIPKCMLTVGNKNKIILLDRLIVQLRDVVENIILVVGYREELIIQHCGLYHRDVILMRNPSYRETNTAYSYWLASRILKDNKVLFIDGDIAITTQSLKNLVQEAQTIDLLIGITPTNSENPIGVKFDQEGSKVIDFSKTNTLPMEWANVFVGKADIFNNNPETYVFEILKKHLPQQGSVVCIAEIDTTQDLVKANDFVDNHPI
jgi:choline kinase